MEVIIIQPGEGPKLIELEGDLDSFQKAVGGWIEPVALKGITGAFAYVNEEGKPRGLMPNTFATSLTELPPGELIRGPMVIVGDRNGNETDVPGLVIDSVFDAHWLAAPVCDECGNPFDDAPGATCQTCLDWKVVK